MKQRFVPSEFGNEVDTVEVLPPFQRVCDNKRKIRRAIEEAGIPFTFFSANTYAMYFIDYLFHPRQKPQPEEVVIYGDGLSKGCASTLFSFHMKWHLNFRQGTINMYWLNATRKIKLITWWLCCATFMNSENDIAALTIMMANDPRTMNKLVIYRPPSNII